MRLSGPDVAQFFSALANAEGRLKMAVNTLKVAGLLALLARLSPLLALVVVGVDGAAYEPAKFGLVTAWMPWPQR